MGLMDTFLKLTISVQIRVGIISVVLFAIIISLALLTVSTLIQYNTMINYYEEIIEDEDNKMLLNFEQYIHNIEYLFDRKSKTDLEFYSILENTFFESLEGLEFNILFENIDASQNEKIYDADEQSGAIDNCFNSHELNCIVYKYFSSDNNYKNSKEFQKIKKYYSLIFPLLKSTLEENCVGTYSLKQYHNLQFYQTIYDNETNSFPIGKLIFYAGNNATPFDREYNEEKYENNTIQNVIDQIIDLFAIIPFFNKKLTREYVLRNFNQNFSNIPLISSKYFFEGDTLAPYKKNEILETNFYENNLLFESKIFNFKQIDISFIEDDSVLLKNESLLIEFIPFISQFLAFQLNSLKIFKWSDNIFEILFSSILERYQNSLNIFSVIHSLFSIFKSEIFKNYNEFSFVKDEFFRTDSIVREFVCLYIVKQELSKMGSSYGQFNPFNITLCELSFNEDFEQYLLESPIKINVYERKKIKVEILKYEINYIYFKKTNDGQYIDEERSLRYDKKEEKDQKLAKNLKSYKIYQGMYPLDTLNTYSSIFFNNFISVNFYFSNYFSNYVDSNNIQDMCFVFFEQVLYPSLILWLIVLVIISIIVFKISHSISDPIDKLIQSVSMSNKSSKELNKYLKNISYKDDSTINDLFVLCKKLIIGGFKKEGEEEFHQKTKIKSINAYNNISLVKTNNMIINESEIMKGEKKQEINYFEKHNLNKSNNFSYLNSQNTSENSDKKFNFRVLSGHLFTGKFYQYNKGYLIKDREYFEIFNNEFMARKKKLFDDNKLKFSKNNNNIKGI